MYCIEPLESRIAPATFIVNSLLDGLPAKDGKLTLREAIIAATTNTAVGDALAGDALADAIVFAPALAGGTIQLNNELVIAAGGQLSITGPGATDGSIVLRGGANSRVLHILDPVDAVLLSHLTITNGNPNDGDGGGGIFNEGGSLFLDDVLLTGNTAANELGGGINSKGSTAKLSMVHSRIVENSADVGGGVNADGLLTIHDTTISSNSAVEGGGIDNHSTATITASRIIGNRGADGDNGAGISNEATMILQDSLVSGNVGLGSGYSGGGIYSNGTLTILTSTISGNLSQGRGGGIHFDGGTLTIINSTIANNTSLGAGGGGGIRVDTPDPLSITNSTVVGNVDATSGGTGAGGILNTGVGAPILANTIVAGNFVASGTSPDMRGSFSAGSANNFIGIGDAALTGIIDGINDNHVGTGAAPLDPKLGSLQDNGGRTFTIAPLAGSPVIDGGLNDAAVKAVGVPLLSDQRGPGFSRTVDGTGAGAGTVDIGAFEFAPAPNVSGVTSFTFIETGGEQVNVALKGGGTFDLVLSTDGGTISRLDLHGVTPSSALAVKVLTSGATVNVAAIHSDAGLKSISLGKGAKLTGSIGIDGALGSLALDTTEEGSFIRTGGTAKQTLNVALNGDFKAAIETTSAVGKLKLPKFNFNGAIRAASIGDITALSFSGTTTDDVFNTGDNTHQDLIATDGPIGKVTTVNGEFLGFDILAGPGIRGTLGGITVTAPGVFGIGLINVTAAQIGPISVKMTLLSGAPARGILNSNFLATNGGIASVAVSLNTTPPDLAGTFGIQNASFTAAAGIGNVTVTSKDPAVGIILASSFLAGTTTLATWAALPTAKLQSAALAKSSLGAIQVAGSIDGSTFVAAGNIGAVTAPLGFSNTKVLAGTSLGADRALGGTDEDADIFVRPVSIGALTLKQPTASSISAGIDPGGDSTFGNFNDVAATAGLVAGGSKIGAVKITASFNFNPANPGMSHGFAIQAAAIAKITINGQNAALGINGVSLDTDTSGTDTFNDIVIHLL